jgi:hypothetical protein
MGTSSAATGKFYPDWSGDNEGCLEDTGSTRAPEYMTQASGTWLFDTLEKCCEQHYSYSLSECVGSSGSGFNAVGSGKWYVDWSTYKCIEDSSGQLANEYGKANLHSTQSKCCQTHVSWDYKKCMGGGGSLTGFTYKGVGYCLDINDNYWNEIESPEFPGSFPDSYCLDYCSQNLHPKFIAVTVDRSDVSMICWCSFTGVNVPSSISLADYSPVGTAAYDDVPTGSVVFADGDTDYQCYTYNVSYFS